MNQQSIRMANSDDLPFVEELYDACKQDLLNKGIFQWDDQYPNRNYFEWSIREKEMYIFQQEDQIIGAFVLNEWQVPEWESVNWSQKDGKYLIIHAFCVNPEAQGSGFGKQMLQFIEKMASEQGYFGIRLDAFSKNEVALQFYETKGYTKRGEVFFASKPTNHEIYYCYDKLF